MTPCPPGCDQPPMLVDKFGVEETASLAWDIEVAAVAVEQWLH